MVTLTHHRKFRRFKYNCQEDTTDLELGIFDLVGVIMLVLAGSSCIYLLRVKNKSSSTWMLLWFFLCVVLSAFATIVTNIGTSWDWAFAPSQDAMIILSGVFLVRFAYLYPANDQQREARWVVAFFVLLALIALTYAVSFAIRYIAYLPGDLNEDQLYYLLTPVAISLTIFVFFRRSMHWSTQIIQSGDLETPPLKPSIKYLFAPHNKSATALRNYGLSLAISLVPAVVLIEKTALPAWLASFLFNFGAVIAIAALMLTYFNYAPESVAISAKLVGISLTSVLLILGLTGVLINETYPGLDEHGLVLTMIALVLLSSLLIILAFPHFFRAALLDPLENLLRGVKAANDGDLTTHVAVQYDDEIGFLTQSFNRMISSLNEATQTIKNEAVILERQVAERTTELRDLNQQLINENTERKEAQALLNRQLRYEHALAGCSQSLFVSVDGVESQQRVLNQALKNLQIGASVSRAYIFHNFRDNDLDLYMGILAEACAEGIQPHLNNPVNQKYPWTQLPEDMYTSLGTGRPHGGPVERVFASAPSLREAFLRQPQPLLSILALPIQFNDQWWGFIGFDDCEASREWDEDEIMMLRTASDMISSALQRWAAEEHLRETLENLEQRVHERTIALSQANAELRHEIHERQRFQDELEEKLGNERTLAKISTRLLSPLEPSNAINDTLADLGAIMQASHVIITQLPNSSVVATEGFIEWHAPSEPSLSNILEGSLSDIVNWLPSILEGRNSIFIEDLPTHPGIHQTERDLLLKKQVKSMVLTPLFMNNHLEGILVCINLKLQKSKILENIQLLDVIASMLSSLLRREALLNSLEEKIAERTRELSAFFDLTVLAGEAQELSDIMQPALAKVMEVGASEAAAIHVFDEEQRMMRVVAQRGFHTKYLTQLETIRLDEATMAWIISRSEDAWSSGTLKHPDAFELPHFQSDTHIPLRARGKIQGLLSCYRISARPFDPYQVFFLNAIGEQLGLAVENYRLRLKAEEIATIQERQRLARELHDAVSQSIYSLTLFARSGRDAFDRGDMERVLDNLEQLEVNSLAALKEMRLLLYQLRSLALEKGGLLQAIESRFNLVERRSGVQAAIVMDESVNLPDRVEQEFFLVISEALNNALKHANANQVSVTIHPDNGNILLVVWNNGKSFDPAHASGGMGLDNMRERASALGGQLLISSQPDSGTWIRVEMPMP
jgi:signal transduction histidine kinase/HAMP domain-containing protein